MSGQRVGIVGDERLRRGVEAAGGTPIEIDPDSIDAVQFIVVGSESALIDLVRTTPDVAVLPAGFDDEFPAVPFEQVETAVTRILDGGAATTSYPVVAATGAFKPIRTLFDVALVAAEPARISEYELRIDGESLARFRADGVVASTPLGSSGYQQNAGGPLVAPGTGVASVVPIAPFATAVGHWVLPIDSVRLTVVRDETPVELLADGRREGTLTTEEPVTLSRVDDLETYVVPELAGPFSGVSAP